MARRSDSLYSGAAGKTLARTELASLGSSYVVQPKLDGIYGYVSTDRTGRISSIVTRTGEVLGPALMAEFRGVRWMPDSLVVAELELWTEASNRAAAIRGYRMLYPFDAQRVGGRDVSREMYRVRRDALLRAEVEVESRGPDRPWVEDEQGDAHDLKSGRYTKATPLGWRRVRVVPQLPVACADRAWTSWVDGQDAGPCEGLVAVALDGQLGGRRTKLKIKDATTIDAVVTAVGARSIAAHWVAGQRTVTVSRPASAVAVTIGDVVELRHESFHDDGAPRFCRYVRVRRDLAAKLAVPHVKVFDFDPVNLCHNFPGVADDRGQMLDAHDAEVSSPAWNLIRRHVDDLADTRNPREHH